MKKELGGGGGDEVESARTFIFGDTIILDCAIVQVSE